MPVVEFKPNSVPDSEQPEIEDLLLLLADGEGFQDRSQREEFQKIVVWRQIGGGYGGKIVLEVELISHKQRQILAAVKIGDPEAIRLEFENYSKHLARHGVQLSSRFAPAFLRPRSAEWDSARRLRRRDAIAYCHVGYWSGSSALKSLEDLAQTAMLKGGRDLETTESALRFLFFNGVKKELYAACAFERDCQLGDYWSQRLGPAATIEAVCLRKGRRKRGSRSILGALDEAEWAAAELKLGDCQAKYTWRRAGNGSVEPRAPVAFPDPDHTLTARWIDGELYGELRAPHRRRAGYRRFRVAVAVPPEELPQKLRDGDAFLLYGILETTREAAHRAQVLEAVPELRFEAGVLRGPGEAHIPDPFDYLEEALTRARQEFPLSLAHGDLNPRNVLIAGDQPYLIDYERTGPNQPVVLDFVWLEVTLARRVLPSTLTWSQHVRLQRLLAAHSRASSLLGEGAEPSAFLSEADPDYKSLIAAFRIFSTVRAASLQAYPHSARRSWYVDYLDNLLITTHVTLKWPEQTQEGLRAVAAIGGVAVEAADPELAYKNWTSEDLARDGLRILGALPEDGQPLGLAHDLDCLLFDLRATARSLERLPGDHTLHSRFESARALYIRASFAEYARWEITDPAKEMESKHKRFTEVNAVVRLRGALASPGSSSTTSKVPAAGPATDAQKAASTEDYRRTTDESEEVFSLLAAYPAAVLLGDAGSGKTTVAEEWCYRLCEAIIKDNTSLSPKRPIFVKGSQLLARLPAREDLDAIREDPVQLETGKTGRQLDDRDLLALKALVHPVVPYHDDPPGLSGPGGVSSHTTDWPPEKLLHHLAIGGFYLVVDALDEIESSGRARVAEWIEAFASHFRLTPVLVCHRSLNYPPSLLSDLPKLLLLPLTRLQIEDYVHHRMGERSPRKGKLASDRAEALLKDPAFSRVVDFVRTPLFLSLTVDFYMSEERLPDSQGELLHNITKGVLTTKAGKAGSAQNGSVENKLRLLAGVAFEMVERQITELPADELSGVIPASFETRWAEMLPEIEETQLFYREGRVYRFMHERFREYLAARWYLMYIREDLDAMRRRLARHSWWETFRMLLSFVHGAEERVVAIIEEVVGFDPLLAASYLRSCEGLDPALVTRFVESQQERLRRPETPEYLKEKARLALEELGSKDAVNALLDLVVDGSLSLRLRVDLLRSLSKACERVNMKEDPALRERVEGALERILDDAQWPDGRSEAREGH